MLTSNWIIKNFYKKSCVRARVLFMSHRTAVYYRIPDENNTITIGERSYIIDTDHFFIEKNIPTYLYAAANAAPLDFLHPEIPTVDPAVFKVAYNQKTQKAIAETSGDKKEKIGLSVVIGAISVLGLIVLGYLGYKEIEALKAQIAVLEQLLRTIGGM